MAPCNKTILNILTSAPWRVHAYLPAFLIHRQEFTATTAGPSRGFVREDAKKAHAAARFDNTQIPRRWLPTCLKGCMKK